MAASNEAKLATFVNAGKKKKIHQWSRLPWFDAPTYLFHGAAKCGCLPLLRTTAYPGWFLVKHHGTSQRSSSYPTGPSLYSGTVAIAPCL